MPGGIETTIPGYVAGAWDIDADRSDVTFSVRHMMVSTVRGRFDDVSGCIVTGPRLLDSSVTAAIGVASLDTGNPLRDEQLRAADLLHGDEFPTMSYRSTGLRHDSECLVVDGELTLHGTTREVPLSLEVTGFGPDGHDGTRAGFAATATLRRRDFGIEVMLDGGGVMAGDIVSVALRIQAVLR